MRPKLLLLLLTAAAPARAADAAGAAREAFDGEKTPAVRLAAQDVCGRVALEEAEGDRGALAASEAVCRPAPGGSAAARLIAIEGLDAATDFPARGRAARLAETARKDPVLGRRLRSFYARVAAVEPSAAREPGWVWRLAMEFAEQDPLQAHRLIAYCGSDEVEREPLREPVSAAQARLAYQARKSALKAAGSSQRLDPKDFLVEEHDVCRAAGAAFFAPGGLAAGVPEAGWTPAADDLFGSPSARAYAASRAACELAATGTPPDAAARAAANAAWASRRLTLAAEARRARFARAALSQRYRDAARRAPSAEAEEDFIDRELRRGRESPRRPQAWLDRRRMDALELLEQPHAAAKMWSERRLKEARAALESLSRSSRAAARAEEAGARFGAAACPARR